MLGITRLDDSRLVLGSLTCTQTTQSFTLLFQFFASADQLGTFERTGGDAGLDAFDLGQRVADSTACGLGSVRGRSVGFLARRYSFRGLSACAVCNWNQGSLAVIAQFTTDTAADRTSSELGFTAKGSSVIFRYARSARSTRRTVELRQSNLRLRILRRSRLGFLFRQQRFKLLELGLCKGCTRLQRSRL
ncbi:hypothetical protein D3C71_1009250 [compost metagenome]